MTAQSIPSKPIPTPPPGSHMEWHLDPPFGVRHLLIALAALSLLLWTGHRVEMDRMVVMSTQAAAKWLGLAAESQVAHGLERVATSMWPPAIEEKVELARLPELDRNRLPWGAHVELQERTEKRMNLQTMQLEETVERTEYLVRPWGYVVTVTLKMLETLEIALWGTLLSMLLSAPLAYGAARNYSPNKAVYTLARGVISLLRSMPELIVALFLVLAYGFGPIAGVLALGLHAAGFLGKFYAEDIENADKKPQEALEAIGAGKLRTLWYGVLPQVMPQYVAYTLYILDRNVRMATVVGLVGAGGIGQELKGRFDMFQYDHVATILIAIFVVVFLLDQFSARLRARLI